ncbi:mucoidy inhibitor MuiA family protein [Ruficoccus sp. ZRK36]|uniref:mucoidy inhibitor MuiA family protein n=1 Tax=Ruficoccus sp. ZRK36 TaxID=2866311 RepID=UPI001C7311DE|nr:mucoidy inhibitor MuiA family protein [Ruficoccus sp. ZRK36]QYY34697.1 mucoidy inhibitor MuiA family protein [Ruficoccus sp. ZRK36]
MPMTRSISLALAALAAPLIVSAAEERILDSQLTAVTVFADRAELVREAKLELDTGTHTLIFADLPARTDAGSLQVDGTGGFTLQDVRFETRQLTDLPEGKLKELTDELEKAQTQATALDMTATRLKDRRTALEAIIGRVTTTPKDGSEPAPMDAVAWTEMLTFYNTQLEKIDETKLANDASQREVNEQISQLRREIAQLNASARKQSNTAKVVVSMDQPGAVSIDLTSIVYGPRWSPSYDIRANTDSKQVTIAGYGSVTQSTGEDWTDVQLSLSTAQPQIGGREPELHPWFVQEFKPMPVAAGRLYEAKAAAPQSNAMRQMMESDSFADAEVASAPEPMRVAEATVQSGATAVVYQIPNTASIPSDNQPVRVSITTQTFPGQYRYSAVPKLSPHVYLKTKVTNTSDYAFLPGPSNIYLDGSFVGNAQVDLVPPGQEFWTWLGIDQGVKVERKLLERKEGTAGIFGGSKTMTYRYEFELKNNKQSQIELVVWDQLPVSQNEDIKVKLIKPDYSEDTDTLKMNSQKYIEWLYTLNPGQEVKTPFEFSITWPEDMQVSGL